MMSVYAYGYVWFSNVNETLDLFNLKNIVKKYDLALEEETDSWIDKPKIKQNSYVVFQILSINNKSTELWFLGEDCTYSIGGSTYKNEKSLTERIFYIQNILNDFLCLHNVSHIDFVLDSCFEIKHIQQSIHIKEFSEKVLKLYYEWNNLTPSFSMTVYL